MPPTVQGVCEHTPGQPLVVQVGMAEEHAPPPALAGQVPPRVHVVVIPGAVVRHRPPQTGSAEQLSPAGQSLFKYAQVLDGGPDMVVYVVVGGSTVPVAEQVPVQKVVGAQ